MRLPPSVALLPVLAGCPAEDTDEIPAEVTAAVTVANDMMGVTLVASEASKQVKAREDRAAGQCPTVTRDGTLQDFTVTADYGVGCIPTSGLVPTQLAGLVTIDYAEQALTTSFSGFSANGNTLDGSIAGSYDGAIVLSLVTALDLTGESLPSSVDETLVVDVALTKVTIDGTAAVDYLLGDHYGLTMVDVVISYADITGSCPVPGSGSITVDNNGKIVVLAFTGDGMVEGTYNGVSYPPIPLCDYASALFE